MRLLYHDEHGKTETVPKRTFVTKSILTSIFPPPFIKVTPKHSPQAVYSDLPRDLTRGGVTKLWLALSQGGLQLKIYYFVVLYKWREGVTKFWLALVQTGGYKSSWGLHLVVGHCRLRGPRAFGPNEKTMVTEAALIGGDWRGTNSPMTTPIYRMIDNIH